MDKLKFVEISWFLFLMLRSKLSNNIWFELLAYALKGRISCLAAELCWHRILLHALIPQLRERLSQLGRVVLDHLSAPPHVQFVPVLHWRSENLTSCCHRFTLWYIAVSSYYEVLIMKYWVAFCGSQLWRLDVGFTVSTFIIPVIFLLPSGTALTQPRI